MTRRYEIATEDIIKLIEDLFIKHETFKGNYENGENKKSR